MNVAVRAPGLGVRSLWLDEAVAVHTSQLDALGIVRASLDDTTPPVYYLLLGAFERLLGISEAAVRWPSVLASGATGAALFFLARRRLGSFAAWCASALFLLSDVNLRYAREARPYALTSFLCVVSFALLFRAVERSSIHAWLALALANALMVSTHYAAIFAVATQGLAILSPWRGWRTARSFLICHAPVVGIFLMWVIPLVAAGQHHKMEWMAAPKLGQLFNVFGWYTGGHYVMARFVFFLIGAIAVLAYARRSGQVLGWSAVPTLMLWGVAPVLLAFTSSHWVRCFHARYVLYATLGMILLWSVAIQSLPLGFGRILAAALICGWTAFGLSWSPRRGEADWRGVARWARAGPPCASARVVLVPGWEARTFAYYYDPPAFRDPLHTLSRLDGCVSLVSEAKELTSLDLAGAQYVSLVVGRRSDASNAARQLVEHGFTELEHRDFGGVSAARLSRADPSEHPTGHEGAPGWEGRRGSPLPDRRW